MADKNFVPSASGKFSGCADFVGGKFGGYDDFVGGKFGGCADYVGGKFGGCADSRRVKNCVIFTAFNAAA